MKNPIPVNVPVLDERRSIFLKQSKRLDFIRRSFVKEFESKFARKHGRKHGIAVCNGTAALQIAVDALDLNPEDEVIVPTFTIMHVLMPS